MTSHAKPVGIALSGEHLTALLADRALTAQLNASGLPFVVAGIDRIDPAVPRSGASAVLPGQGRTVESSIATATLAARAPRLGWLAAAAVHRDHPYNLARRVASADHLSGGRAGLVLGLRDRFAPAGRDGHEVWGGAGLTGGVPVGPATTRDAASAIRALWQSWPAESIVADRETRVYARADQIKHIDHRGAFDIDGPLTVPATPQGSPVLAWRAGSTGEAAAARGVADILIWPAGEPATVRGEYPPLEDSPAGERDRLQAVAAAGAAGSGGPRLYLEIPAGGTDLAARLAGYLADARVAGVILRPWRSEAVLREFLARVLPELTGAGAVRTGWSGTLRERLSLPVPEPLPATARPAFPAPAPAAPALPVTAPVPVPAHAG
jgi:alkanesulfonate monooxygenase SsuD/methylene tetrahydromethanopterin reductase-like flavin-dependent oxidoreductase (luciferase family)